MSSRTFADVEKKYRYIVEHVEFCRELALNKNVPANAPWFDNQTTAKWLYGSVVEFAADYQRMAADFEVETPQESESLGAWYEDLDLRVVQMRDTIVANHPALAEVLR